MIPAFDDTDLQRDISNIEKKREVLQQIIAVAKAVENMQESLDSVLVLGIPSKDLPQGVMDLYGTISENLKSLPVNKIEEYQENLEGIVRNQLERILSYAGIAFEHDDGIELLTLSSDDTEGSPLDLLEDFRRTAQTTVSLRVLLRKRGVATPGSQLPVPEDVIEQQLALLKVQEQHQRERAKQKIEEMQDDITEMMQNPAYPEGMKDTLRGVRENLDGDIERLDNGVAIHELSLVMDAEELVAAPLEEAPEAIEITAVVAEEPQTDLPEAASRWLNSPWSVSWHDAKEGNGRR